MAARRTRSGTVLPSNPQVGDIFTLLGAPDPDAKCLVDGVWSSHGGSITRDTIALGFKTGPAGITEIMGGYIFAPSDDDFIPSVLFGTVNEARGAHLFLVQAAGAGGGDTTIRITGTSITGLGIRTPGDTEDLVMGDAAAAGTYYETIKRWNGQVTIAKQSGPDLPANHGWATYFDNANNDYILTSMSVTWLAGANDSGFDMQLLLHSSSGWTYTPGGEPVPAVAIVSSGSDLAPENEVFNGETGQWSRGQLNISVAGSVADGLIFRAVTGVSSTIEQATVLVTVVPQ